MTNASKFLQSWVQENVNATVYDDAVTAKHLAAQCLWEAQGERLSVGEVVEAAGGDLVAFILVHLNRAVDREVEDRVARDKL